MKNQDSKQQEIPASGPLNGAPRTKRLGALLVQHGLITEDQLQEALELQYKSGGDKQLGAILVDMEVVDSATIVRIIANDIGVPFEHLTPDMVHGQALTCLPHDYMSRHNLLPLVLTEEWVTIAVEQCANVLLIEDIRSRVGKNVRVIAAVGDNIRQTRQTVMQGSDISDGGSTESAGQLDVLDILGQMEVDDLTIVENELPEEDADLVASATESPVVKLVNFIIRQAVDAEASDIHIEPDDNAFIVRTRIDGELVEVVRPPARLLPAVVSRIKIMAGLDISERRLPQDGAVTVTLAHRPIDLRVSTMATKYGEKVVMRVVDRLGTIRTLESLGFQSGMLSKFRRATSEPNGIILVTGPTGSGKSTTLYAALSERVSKTINICTIEDPVERRLVGSNQFQVHPQAGFTFATALRSLLRQDPDVIMVGEIRDAETAKLAAEAALTGHLVLSTLHTNDAPTAIPRLVNMGVETYLIAASVRVVLAQRLVRQLCEHCKKAVEPTMAERSSFERIFGTEAPLQHIYAADGCKHCHNRGFSGRIGVFELLELDEHMLSVVLRDPGAHQIRSMCEQQGMSSLLDDALQKVREGQIALPGLFEVALQSQISTVSEASVDKLAA